MQRHSGPTREDVNRALEQVEQEILILQQKKARLLTYLNQFAHISMLPTEVLLQIFRNCMPSGQDLIPSGRKGLHSWLSFSRVCRMWRKLALDHQSLWTRPVFKCPSLAQVMMDRAGDRPLEVILWDPMIPDSQDSLYDDWFGLLVGTGKSKYIRSLELHLSREMIQLSLPDLSDVPMLEQLCLKPVDGSENAGLILPPARIKAPRLQDLEVHSFQFPLFTNTLTNLTRLCIRHPDGHSSSPNLRLDTGRALDLFRKAPALRYVELINAVSASELGSLSRLAGSVVMPKLETLTVVDEPETTGIMELLLCLSVPNLREFSISLTSPGDPSRPTMDLECAKRILSTVKGFATCYGGAPWRALSLDGAEDDLVVLKLGTLTPYHGMSLPAGNSAVDGEWRVDFRLQPSERDYLLEQLRQSVRLEEVQSLHVRNLPGCWKTMGALPALFSVMLDNTTDVHDLLELYRSGALGQLSTIYLTRHVSECDIEALVENLESCIAAGMPLRELCVKGDSAGIDGEASVLWNCLRALGLQVTISNV